MSYDHFYASVSVSVLEDTLILHALISVTCSVFLTRLGLNPQIIRNIRV